MAPGIAVALLKETLVRQYGPATRDVVEAEVEGRLAGRTQLAREDLDAIEQNIMMTLRQRRGTTRVLPRQGSGRAPALSTQRSSPAWHSVPNAVPFETPHPGLRKAAAPPSGTGSRQLPQQSAAICAPGEKASLKDAGLPRSAAGFTTLALSASAGTLLRRKPPPYGLGVMPDDSSERSCVVCHPRYHVPLRPKLKPMDHWDLIVAYDSKTNLEEAEAFDKGGKHDEQLKFRSILDSQMEELRAVREQQAEDRRQELSELQAQWQENTRILHAEEAREKAKVEAMKKANAVMTESIKRREERVKAKKQKEQDDVLTWSAGEKKRQEEERREHAIEYERKCRLGREEMEKAHADADRRKKERKAEEKRACEAAVRAMDDAESGNRAAVAERWARMEELQRTFGAAIAERDAKAEAKMQADIKRVQEEGDRRAREDAEMRRTEHSQKVQDMLATLNKQMKDRENEAIMEAEANRKQAQIWREQLDEATRKEGADVLKRKQARQAQDEYLVNQMRAAVNVHPLQFGMTDDTKAIDVAYNQAIFEQMVEEGVQEAVPFLALAAKSRRNGRSMPHQSIPRPAKEIHPMEYQEADV